MNAIAEYIREAREELHHVRWPTRQQSIRLSIIVLGFTAASAILFGATDFVLTEAVKFVLLNFI